METPALEKKLSVAALARRVGLSQSLMSQLYRGARGMTPRTAAILGRAWGIDPDKLLGLSREGVRLLIDYKRGEDQLSQAIDLTREAIASSQAVLEMLEKKVAQAEDLTGQEARPWE